MKLGDRTQLKILKAANTLFYHQGYNHTSFSHIVEKTGLSKGNITYHFKSKQDILKGIILLRLEKIQTQVDAWNTQTDDPMQRLDFFCKMLLDEGKDLQQFGCPIGTLTSEFAKNDPELYQATLPMFETYKAFLAEQYQLLGLTRDNSEQKAMRLLGRAQGIAMMTHVFRDVRYLHEEVEHLQNEIKNALD